MAFWVSLQLINQTKMESHNNWMHRKQGQLFSTLASFDVYFFIYFRLGCVKKWLEVPRSVMYSPSP